MLLRSSSTPILGSLLSPIQEGSNNHETNATHHNHSYNKLSYVACKSSPRSPSVADRKCIRRAQSEGNLQGLAYGSCKDEEGFCSTNQPSNKKVVSGRNKCLMLESIPSFSYSHLGGRREDDDSDWEDDEEMWQGNRRGGERVMAIKGMVLSEDIKAMETLWNVGFEGERGMGDQEMHLAKGLGIGGTGGGRGSKGGGGGGSESSSAGSGGDGGDGQGVEEYYKKMVEENPGNPLFLSNYAHFLYQSKQDLPKAEDYYSRAILADPGDGEILSQYAKLVWELYQDEDRAATYYERAVHAFPEDSHVHASYAGFLWETEEDDDECDAPSDFNSITPQIHQAAEAPANAQL